MGNQLLFFPAGHLHCVGGLECGEINVYHQSHCTIPHHIAISMMHRQFHSEVC